MPKAPQTIGEREVGSKGSSFILQSNNEILGFAEIRDEGRASK